MSRITNRLAWIVFVGLMAILPLTASAEHNLKGRIVFIIDSDVYTMKPDGSDLRQLTDFAPQGARARQPSWSHDGKQIVFHFFASQDAQARIWVMKADGTGPRQVFDDSDAGDFSAEFSPDDSKIIFSHCPDTCAIYRVNVDGTGLTPVTQLQLEIIDGSPSYSPDGHTIAFTSLSRGGVIAAVYLMDENGDNIHRITPPVLVGGVTGWFPDGEHFAFFSHCCVAQNSEIWSIRPNGHDLNQITDTDDKNDFSPSVSPDGSAIVFERDGPLLITSAIFVKNLDGSERAIFRGPRPADLPLNLPRSWRGKPDSRERVIQNGGFSPKWGPAAD